MPAKEASSNGGESIHGSIEDEDAANSVNSKGTRDKALEWEAASCYCSCSIRYEILGKDVIYSQDLGYLILGLRILNPGNCVLGLRFKDPES